MLNFEQWNNKLLSTNGLSRMGAGVMCECNTTGKVLLLRREPSDRNGLRWCFPGGGVENGEGQMEAAIRECGEEMGGLPPGAFTGARSVFDIGTFRYITYRYLCESKDWEPRLNEEHVDFAWASPNSACEYELIDMDGADPITQALDDLLDYRHSVVMVDMDQKIRNLMTGWARRTIDPADLVQVDGFETKAHVTVLYGIREKTPVMTTKVCKRQAPVDGVIGRLDVFENGKEDVLIARISSSSIERLRSCIRAGVPHQTTFPDYKPHMTIAYLKPGTSRKYMEGHWPLDGVRFSNGAIRFGGWQGSESAIGLAGSSTEIERDFYDRSAWD